MLWSVRRVMVLGQRHGRAPFQYFCCGHQFRSLRARCCASCFTLRCAARGLRKKARMLLHRSFFASARAGVSRAVSVTSSLAWRRNGLSMAKRCLYAPLCLCLCAWRTWSLTAVAFACVSRRGGRTGASPHAAQYSPVMAFAAAGNLRFRAALGTCANCAAAFCFVLGVCFAAPGSCLRIAQSAVAACAPPSARCAQHFASLRRAHQPPSQRIRRSAVGRFFSPLTVCIGDVDAATILAW